MTVFFMIFIIYHCLYKGQPINEPIFQYGPFVLTTEKELNQTFEDYQLQKNGFEGSLTWNSAIKNMKYKKK